MTSLSTTVNGTTYITKYKGKSWPIVLCDESLAPRTFLATRQRREHLPAIALGIRRFIWAHPNLHVFNDSEDYLAGTPIFQDSEVLASDSETTKTEKYRQLAFRRDMTQRGDDRFWTNYVNTEVKARQAQQDMASGRANINRDMTNEEREGLHVFPRPSWVRTPALSNSISHRDDRTFSSVARIDPTELETIRANNANLARQAATKNACIVFVGLERRPFQINEDRVHKLDAFEIYAQDDEELGHYADLSAPLTEESEGLISVEDFLPVFAHLQGDRNSVSPNNDIPDPHEYQRIKSDLDRLMSLYLSAAKVGYTDLQDLISDYINFLPLQPNQILGIGRIVVKAKIWPLHQQADLKMYQWLVRMIVKYFWVMTTCGNNLKELFDESKYLRVNIFAAMGNED